jgi:predicted deacylase
MSKPFQVGEVTLNPGEKAQGVLTISEFWSDGQSLEIPYMVIRGASPGKVLYVQVAQHGSEIMGLEAVRRLLNELNPSKMSGSIIYCLPNPLAFRERTRSTLFDAIPGGMNRIWPGDPEGSLTERMAYNIWSKLVTKADLVVDLHTASRICPAWVFYEAQGVSPKATKETTARSEEMARVFGAPIMYVETEAYGGRKTLRACCVDEGIPAVVPELGGSGYFDEEIIQLTHRGLRNIMISAGLLEGKVELPRKQVKLEWRNNPRTFTSQASKGGVFLPSVKIGDTMSEGEKVGYIYSPRTFEILEEPRAVQDGYVFNIRENPVVHQGDRLVATPRILEWLENP